MSIRCREAVRGLSIRIVGFVVIEYIFVAFGMAMKLVDESWVILTQSIMSPQSECSAWQVVTKTSRYRCLVESK